MTPMNSGRIMTGEDIIRMSLRDLRRLKVLQSVMDRRITQSVAASMLDLSERHLRRLLKLVRELGDGGIIHRG